MKQKIFLKAYNLIQGAQFRTPNNQNKYKNRVSNNDTRIFYIILDLIRKYI